ncbi:hypothetical protein QVD17_19926 [Tagetes erecta]|uniref:Uncharacterized protein n=1 Tax=Tagetes erecta TaxID=13708 RepID=A0AAD8NWW9_TARER|nr:hypothetical protein QVD17_19926 [Tagetes erecta]
MRAPKGEMNTSLKKGSWSLEEDQKLVSYINRYGIWNWTRMPEFAGLLRSGKSCRLRWLNYLKPNIKRGSFSKEEEEIILHSHSLLGNRWSAIATRLPGRTDNEIKNYWHTHLKKRVTHTPNDSTISSAFKANDNQNTGQSVNHVTEIFISQSSTSFEDDSSSYTTSTCSIDQEIGIKDNYYDIGSPGTVEDLQWFWKQLCPNENFEIGNNHVQDQHFSDLVFEDSFHDSTGLYGA